MGDLKVYDADKVTVNFAGIPIESGYAEGEFVTIEQDEADFTKVVGTDGEVTRSKTNNRCATVTIKLMQSSSSNALLSAISNLDKSAGNGAGVAPFMVRDRQGTALYTASKAWIAKPPSVSFDKTATAREWTLECADLVRLDGGN